VVVAAPAEEQGEEAAFLAVVEALPVQEAEEAELAGAVVWGLRAAQ
jgi:hypothetical protein